MAPRPAGLDGSGGIESTVSEVVPVVGLPAEIGEAGRLTAADCAAKARRIKAGGIDEPAKFALNCRRSRVGAWPLGQFAFGSG